MGLWSKIRDRRARQRADRRHFPRRWLTYRRRVREDVDAAYQTEAGKSLFDEKYVAALTVSVQQIEQWQIKLFAYQFSLGIFVTLALLPSDASFTLFGVSLKNAVGFKELILAVWSLLAVPSFALDHTRQLRLIVIEKLTELKAPEEVLGFAKLGTAAPFNVGIYLPKQYNDWVFPTLLPSRASFATLTVLGALWLFALVIYSTFLWAYLLLQIWMAPTLGIWSYVVVVHAFGTGVMCVLWLAHAHLPMRYRDAQALKDLAALKVSDPTAHSARLREMYGGTTA